MVANDVDVLVNRIGSAGVPGGFDALLGRQEFDKLAEFTAKHPPALLDMFNQGMGLVLGQYANTTNA